MKRSFRCKMKSQWEQKEEKEWKLKRELGMIKAWTILLNYWKKDILLLKIEWIFINVICLKLI